MRPEILFPLFAPLSNLPGIGPRLEKLLAKLTGPHVVDVLWHMPTGVIDRSKRVKVSDLVEGEMVTVEVTVDSHREPPSRRQPYRVICSDETGFITLIFFHAHKDYLKKNLPEGEHRIVSGRVEVYSGAAQITHPDYIVDPKEAESLPLFEPTYGLTAGVTIKTVHKAIEGALDQTPQLPEWLDGPLVNREGWPLWHEALQNLHQPDGLETMAEDHPARQRLAFDELLASQLALRLTRRKLKRQKGRSLTGDGSLRDKVIHNLPFELTRSQVGAIDDILTDMGSEDRMLRMLQGDVGSGKTLVALVSMLNAVEAGTQAAMMAPTELLAHQHFETIEPMAKAVGIEVALITARGKGKARREALGRLASGDIRIAIGTHALFQDDVEFKDLGLAVVDEQHRFGVHQRIALSDKGPARADILVMTATPIPRTLTLTYYGDMDLSLLKEKPPGRQPISTRAMPLERLGEVVDGVGRALASGARAYWVCPLVEESDVLDVAAAEERYASLNAAFPGKVGLIHGRMKAVEKDEVMDAFQSGMINILVATTVIEVGVDVPEATIMVIEHSERFGLSQLHQLRGRVGRGDKPSTCLLLYQAPLGPTAHDRIAIMRKTDDGFRIAEEDLRLRGPGDVLGVRQSGLPVFRIADLTQHSDLLKIADKDAERVVETDPNLLSDRGKALRVLLYLFEKDEAVRFIRSG
jgi:ATP-dependent DNA helicase RecG